MSFKTDSIPRIVSLFNSRGVHLYHSCQLEDFISYLSLGGIPSRANLEKAQKPMTPFTTDENDRINNVWDKVFLNLEDFGKIFASGRAGVPNVYGPILFRFMPATLLNAVDIAICLRSAGASGFDRERESFININDVDRLFYYPIDHTSGTALLKFKPLLQKDFGPKAQSVEISCTYHNGIMPFTDLVDVVVDPYKFEGTDLASIVLSEAKKRVFDFPIRKRKSTIDSDLYQIFLSREPGKPLSPIALVKESAYPYLINWANKIEGKGGLLLKNYYRFLEYLHAGTVSPIKENKLTNEVFTTNYYDVQFAEDFPYEEVFDRHLDYIYDEEYEIIQEELIEYGDNWGRSSEKGWFYPDDE